MIRALLGLLALIAAPASAEPAPPELAAELRANTRALLDSVAPSATIGAALVFAASALGALFGPALLRRS
jgi:hypothetical protein